MPTEAYLHEGRLLFQRMLTLNVDQRHADAVAEMFACTDVRVIMTALTCTSNALAKTFHIFCPDPADRAAALQAAFLRIDDVT